MATSRYVLDTGAFLSRLHPTDGPLYTTTSAQAELRPKAARRYLEQLEASGNLELALASEPTQDLVRQAASLTGDLAELSTTDIELLALAVDIPAILVTSDHRMQNVAQALNLEFLPLTEGRISQQWTWVSRCRGCGRRFTNDEGPYTQCPVCGSELRKVRQS